jgi:hypothetical protein
MKRSLAIASAAMILLIAVTGLHAATDFHQAGISSGGGAQNVAMTFNAISGTMVAQVPRFNGALGTLIQADLEFAGSATGSWVATSNPTGTDSLSISGPVDVDGTAMGPMTVGFSGTINNTTPSNEFDANSVFLTVTSGPFFNTITGAGNLTFSWVYSGSTAVSVPATPTNGFDWGGSAHVLYTYEPVPEPTALMLLAPAGAMLLRRRRR